MSDLVKEFEAVVERVRSVAGSPPPDPPFKPSVELMQKLYGLYKQATVGDVQGKRPGIFDMVGRYKYDAWAALKGTSRDQAMRQYIAEVAALEKQYGPSTS